MQRLKLHVLRVQVPGKSLYCIHGVNLNYLQKSCISNYLT